MGRGGVGGGGGAGRGVLNEGHSSGQCSRFFSVSLPLEYRATGEQSGVRIVGVKSQQSHSLLHLELSLRGNHKTYNLGGVEMPGIFDDYSERGGLS